MGLIHTRDNTCWDIRVSIKNNGYYIAESCLDDHEVLALKDALEQAIECEAPLHRQGKDDPLQVVCCPYYSDIFFEAIEHKVYPYVDSVLGEGCTFYNYSNSSIQPGALNFSGRIHIERRIDSQNPDMLGLMILLDDFSERNGATWFLPGSHGELLAPSPDDFYSTASRLIARSGTLFFFHPSLWHAGGENCSAMVRHALTIGFCSPRLKQRFDMPAMLLERRDRYSKATQVKIGFDSLPPATVKQFYEGKGGWVG